MVSEKFSHAKMVPLEREWENNTSPLRMLSGSSTTFTFFRSAADFYVQL
jgi:hypothetical protein